MTEAGLHWQAVHTDLQETLSFKCLKMKWTGNTDMQLSSYVSQDGTSYENYLWSKDHIL
jgi:hypothetical protein